METSDTKSMMKSRGTHSRGDNRWESKKRRGATIGACEAILFVFVMATSLAALLFPTERTRVAAKFSLRSLGGPPSNGPCGSATVHSTETFWVAMPSWDDLMGLHRALRSVYEQKRPGFGRIHVVVFEDYSANMLSPAEQELYRSVMTVTFLRNTKPPNLGSAYGKHVLFDWLRSHALPHEYVLILDGDDKLADEWVVHDMHVALSRAKPWFAWGKQNGKFADSCTKLDADERELRYLKWSFCHPRVFRVHLLDHFGEGDLRHKNGSWLQKATDAVFIYKFMELSGPKRLLFLHERQLYNYTFGHQNGLKVFKKKQIVRDKRDVQTRKPAKRLGENIHVLWCVNDRQDWRDFLRQLAGSQLQEDQTLNVHVCNRDETRQELMERAAADLQRSHSQVTVDVTRASRTKGDLGMFTLGRDIMKKSIVDYFVLIDEMQNVEIDSMAEVYKARKPLHFSIWNKKMANEVDAISPLAERCSRQISLGDRNFARAGISIIDASIFNSKELFEMPDGYATSTDLWIFHIVQLLGWQWSVS